MRKKGVIPAFMVAFFLLHFAISEGQKKRLDVPFVATPHNVVVEMLRIAEVQKGDVLYDLGCGDGRIVIAAAQKAGAHAVGVEIDPQRIRESQANAVKARVEHLVKFLEQDFFKTDLREASVVTLYLLPFLNVRLRPKLLAELKPGSRIVSHDFRMGEWIPDRSLFVLSGKRLHTLYCWVVPANVSGTWTLKLKAGFNEYSYNLQLDQVFQFVQGDLTAGESRFLLKDVQLTGDRLHFTVEWKKRGKKIRLVFGGRTDGHTMEGTAEAKADNNALEGTWKAERDPATAKPIDIMEWRSPRSSGISHEKVQAVNRVAGSHVIYRNFFSFTQKR